MLTTFDRYLTRRLLHTFVLLFIAAYGLFVVIDLFMNIDDFHEVTGKAGSPAADHDMFLRIGEYYFFHVFEFFELAGPILIVVSVIAILGLLQKSSETFPLLAAGIPTFRLLRPLLLAAAILNLALIANQEFAVPSLAVQLQTPRGSRNVEIQRVEPVYDYTNSLMLISGDRVLVESQTIVNASFSMLESNLNTQPFVLKAETARFVEPTAAGKTRRGYLLQNLTDEFDPTILTDAGRERIVFSPDGNDVFIASELSFDELYNRGQNLHLLSSSQLVHRIRNASTGSMPLRGQSMALHSRITRPIICLLSITIALPLVIRRESTSLITNMAVCAAVLGVFHALGQGCQLLCTAGLLEPDLAAWLPVIVSSIASTWTAAIVQT
jgi:lipopolysaccharide export system permease protein